MMNCPSRNDDTNKHPSWNQTPPALNADVTTRADLNGISNLRDREDGANARQTERPENRSIKEIKASSAGRKVGVMEGTKTEPHAATRSKDPQKGVDRKSTFIDFLRGRARRFQEIVVKYAQFIGPGFLIAVAYIDPGNYATDVNGKNQPHKVCIIRSLFLIQHVECMANSIH
jgi:metal iron transporter